MLLSGHLTLFNDMRQAPVTGEAWHEVTDPVLKKPRAEQKGAPNENSAAKCLWIHDLSSPLPGHMVLSKLCHSICADLKLILT